MHLNKICPVCHQSFEARRNIVPIIVEKNIIKKHTIVKIGL